MPISFVLLRSGDYWLMSDVAIPTEKFSEFVHRSLNEEYVTRKVAENGKLEVFELRCDNANGPSVVPHPEIIPDPQAKRNSYLKAIGFILVGKVDEDELPVVASQAQLH